LTNREIQEPIQLFKPFFRVEESLVELKDCLVNGWTGLGFKTAEFESKWSEYSGLEHAHFLNSNTAGLHLALEVLKRRYDWGLGDEVITTPLTFVSSNHSIVHAGLTPVFADVDDSLCLDPESILQKITPRTRAIMFVGLGGTVGQLQEVALIAKEHNLKLILDAAHMSGTRYLNGEHVGAESDVTVFSFQAVKNLPTGDSGMICFSDAENDDRVRKLSWLGIDKDTYSRSTSAGEYKWMYEVEEIGYKYNGNAIMAGLGLVALRYLDEDNSFRRSLAEYYVKQLSGKKGISVIEHSDCVSSRHLMQVRVANRDRVMQFLNQNGIFPGVHYRDNTAYKMYAHAFGSCPRATEASSQIISLPMHLGLKEDSLNRVCENLISATNI